MRLVVQVDLDPRAQPLDDDVVPRIAADVERLLQRQRCRIDGFVKLGRTIREHRDGILAAVRLGLTNARVEGLNNRVRLITRRAFGFHSAKAAAALVMLSCGPITSPCHTNNDNNQTHKNCKGPQSVQNASKLQKLQQVQRAGHRWSHARG